MAKAKKTRTTLSSNEIRVKDWADLCSQVFVFRKDGHWIFRGLRTAAHALIPKIGRPGARKSISDGAELPYLPASEELMLDYFIRAAPPHLRHVPGSRLEWLAVAQHHGMATRLLDWTESLLVAAFFAVRTAGTGDTPIIYAAKNVPIAPKRFHNRLGRLPSVALYYPPHLSPNIPAQRSVFTVHREPAAEFQPNNLVKIVLEWTAVRSAPITYRLNLDACGINMASLFPDINGLAEHVSWLYKRDRLPPSL
jgi:hypothetical protein